MVRETWVQSQVESYQKLKKWFLLPPCLTFSIIRYGSRVNRSIPGKGVAPSPTPRCCSYRKGRLRGHHQLQSPTLQCHKTKPNQTKLLPSFNTPFFFPLILHPILLFLTFFLPSFLHSFILFYLFSFIF